MNIQTKEQAQSKARALNAFLATQGCTLGYRKALDAIAVVEGLANWNTLSARLQKTAPSVNPAPAASLFALAPATQRIFSRLYSAEFGLVQMHDLHKGLATPVQMSKETFEALQHLVEWLDLEVAQGHDCTEDFDSDHEEAHRLLEASGWTMHPDHGCVRAADVAELDRQESQKTQAERAAGATWRADFVRISHGTQEFSVEAGSLEEALDKAHAEAGDRFYDEDSYNWFINSASADGVPQTIPSHLETHEATAQPDNSHIVVPAGRCRYELRVSREGYGFTSLEGQRFIPEGEEGFEVLLDRASDRTVSEGSSEYFVEVVSVTSLN